MNRFRTVRWLSVGPFLLVVGFVVGCGKGEPKRYPVSGTVKYKGEPIKYGNISFRADNGASGGADIRDGKYEIPAVAGLPEGSYRVAVTYPDPKVPAPRPDEPPGPSTPVRELLPAKYNDKTELTAQIKAEGANDVSFDLK
ncbi:MAG: hypothetical protein J0I06_27730 [Planctomycetes bacterium]|nr:hypothetical protein [Planctomycetota bacterium]